MRENDTQDTGAAFGPPLEKTGASRRPYEAPCLIRIHVETARMKLGYNDASTYCTIHDHDIGFNTCTIS
jgi:hypothetical protein